MASIKNLLVIFAIIVSSTVTLTQGTNLNQSRSEEAKPNPPHGWGREGVGHGRGSEEVPPQPPSALGLLDYVPFQVPIKSAISGAEFFLSGSRPKRTLGHHVVKRNYATEGLLSCSDCNTVRHCYPLNIGAEHKCNVLLPYCNNGHCSHIQGSKCSATSSSSTSTTMSSPTK